ncbi:MAG: multidrug effflux MFS transporter [Burkholderiales bacterium]|nr:multidrug effflux MFS transporter [Burkholderiales bacterium]
MSSSVRPSPARAAEHPALLILLLAGLAMFGPFSIDTVFPMFPVMEHDLAIGPVQMQQTISAYLFAYGLMALLHGPLSDAMGRRTVILAGVGAFSLASIGCANAHSIGVLLFFRGVQGVSAGSGLIVGRAIIRDRFHGAEAQRVMSHISLIFGVAPAIAPIIGGYIGTRMGWQAIFWFLAIFSALLLASCWRWLPETHAPEHRLNLAIGPLFRRYGDMFTNPRFLWLSTSGAFNFSALFIFIASAPVFVLTHLHLGPTDFAYFFVPTISGMMIGAYLSGKRAGKHAPEANVRLAYRCMFGAGAVNLAYCALAPAIAWPWAVLPILATGIGISLAFPTLALMVLDMYPQERGTATSLQTFIQLMVSSLIAGVVSPWVARMPLMLAVGSACCTLIGWLCWRFAQRCLPVQAVASVEA